MQIDNESLIAHRINLLYKFRSMIKVENDKIIKESEEKEEAGKL